MIKNLSICIVTKNNNNSIKDCIESVNYLTNDISVIDMDSTDDTLDIIKQYGCKILNKKLKYKKDNKNYLIEVSKNDWIFFIEPNEKIINGFKEFSNLTTGDENKAYSTLILKNNILSKSLRIFNKKNKKIIFENPIYENIYYPSIKTGIVLKEIIEDKIDEEYKEILSWKNDDKLKSSPIYYECLYFIKNKKYDDFLRTAEKYLFLEENNNLPSYLMIKYYLSLVYFYAKKDLKNSIKNITFCLEKNPTMSEFWCLLGDINFELKKYEKAYHFYNNAIILGKQRSNDDDLPIEVIKYKEYPEKIKDICKNLI